MRTVKCRGGNGKSDPLNDAIGIIVIAVFIIFVALVIFCN